MGGIDCNDSMKLTLFLSTQIMLYLLFQAHFSLLTAYRRGSSMSLVKNLFGMAMNDNQFGTMKNKI